MSTITLSQINNHDQLIEKMKKNIQKYPINEENSDLLQKSISKALNQKVSMLLENLGLNDKPKIEYKMEGDKKRKITQRKKNTMLKGASTSCSVQILTILKALLIKSSDVCEFQKISTAKGRVAQDPINELFSSSPTLLEKVNDGSNKIYEEFNECIPKKSLFKTLRDMEKTNQENQNQTETETDKTTRNKKIKKENAGISKKTTMKKKITNTTTTNVKKVPKSTTKTTKTNVKKVPKSTTKTNKTKKTDTESKSLKTTKTKKTPNKKVTKKSLSGKKRTLEESKLSKQDNENEKKPKKKNVNKTETPKEKLPEENDNNDEDSGMYTDDEN